MKTLILYYSYGGNTRKIAKLIHAEIGGDIAEIEMTNPYTGSYNAVVEQGKKEVDSGFMPEIKPLNIDLFAYDTILLGSPVWWYTFAPAVRTLLHSNDFSGKSIYPFATNGSWLGHTIKDFEKDCAGAVMYPGIDILFNGTQLKTSESNIKTWAKAIK